MILGGENLKIWKNKKSTWKSHFTVTSYMQFDNLVPAYR